MPVDIGPLREAFSTYFSSSTRLFRLQGEGPLGELLVQAWSLKEELSATWTLELTALSLHHDRWTKGSFRFSTAMCTTRSPASRPTRRCLLTRA